MQKHITKNKDKKERQAWHIREKQEGKKKYLRVHCLEEMKLCQLNEE